MNELVQRASGTGERTPWRTSMDAGSQLKGSPLVRYIYRRGIPVKGVDI